MSRIGKTSAKSQNQTNHSSDSCFAIVLHHVAGQSRFNFRQSCQAGMAGKSTVIPAKAGIQKASRSQNRLWATAFGFRLSPE